MPLGRGFIRAKVDDLLCQADVQTAPVDLCRLAEFQGVSAIVFRPLLGEGGIDVAGAGFEISVNDRYYYRAELTGQMRAVALQRIKGLTRRQRFTLAHELAHSLFFDRRLQPPRIVKGAPRKELLEHYCHYGARRMLMPESLLVPLVKTRRRLSAKFVLHLCAEFSVSAEVAVRRLDDLVDEKISSCAIVFARFDESYADASILGACTDASITCYLEKPELYTSLREWCGKLLEPEFWQPAYYSRRVTRRGGDIVLRKVPYQGRLQEFFLELDLGVVD